MTYLIPALLALQSSTIGIDPSAHQGKWEGWGTSLCWMGKAYGDRDDLADLLFTTKTVEVAGKRLPGLGMNIVRYNAGACSWNEVDGRKMVVGKTIQPFRQMEGFWLDPASADPNSKSWDWSLDAKQRAMMLKAKERGADRFELFSNAPMWWMCANDNPSGAADPTHDNLRKDQFDNFAIYLATVAQQAKKRWGVSFTTVDPFNEPLSRWWDENCKQEGCHFSLPAQIDLLPRLRRELDRRGLRKLPIAASDETHVTDAITAWKGYDDATRALVSQINVHGYEGDKSPRTGLRQTVADRKLWMSEHGEGDGSGLSLARAMGLDFHELKPTAWCYWQPMDGGGWGMLDSDVPRAGIRSINPKYFVFAQYSRHIRPGMTILGTSDASAVAAIDPKRKKLVVVLSNVGATEAAKTVDLSAFGKTESQVAQWITEPKGLRLYAREADLTLSGASLTTTLPPHSILTLEFSGVQLPRR